MEKSGASKNFASFEQVFEDMDVRVADMEGSMNAVTGQSVEDSEAVTQLLQQMQAEGALGAA